MQYDSERPSSSSGGALAVLMGLLVLGLIVFGGGAFVWLTRVRTAEQAILRERAAAENAMRQAQAAVEAESLMRETLEPPQAMAPPQDPLDAARQQEALLPSVDLIDVVAADGAMGQASITIDADGNVAIHGVALPFEQIDDKFKELVATDPSARSISIWADEACDFRHVAEVVRQCKAVGIGTIQIAVQKNGQETRRAK